MNGVDYTARILAPIWQGFFIAELVSRELRAELGESGRMDDQVVRDYADLLAASDYLKRRGLEFDSTGLMTALGAIGGKAYLWPWDGDLSEAFTVAITEMFTRNPKLRHRAEKVGMGLSSLEKLNRDIQQHNENVKRLQAREEAKATA